jgi:hypothetical protein
MITNRFAKFAATSIAAAAIGLGALATAATASADTYQDNPGWCLNGSTQWHCGERQIDVR